MSWDLSELCIVADLWFLCDEAIALDSYDLIEIDECQAQIIEAGSL